MKKKIIMLLALPFIAGSMHGQQLININSVPTTQQDVVRSIPGSTTTLNRLGHLQSGTWASGWDTWSALGLPIVSTLGNTPNDQTLYGLTVNNQGDRTFFGNRFLSSNRCDGIVAWGDDNWGNSSSNPDRLVFEFHDSQAGGGNIIRQAMTMMPNPSNNGVFVGIGTYNPTEQLHTTQGVRHQGMVVGSVTHLVGIDANGVLWRTPMVTGSGFGNLCGSTANPITADFQMPLGGKRYYFTGQGPIGPANNQDAVGVGYTCNTFLPARLSVLESQGTNLSIETYAGHFKNANTVNNTSYRVTGGVYGEAKGNQSGNTATPPINIGGVFEAYGTQANIGVCGRVTKSSFPNIATNYPNARYAIGGAFMSDTAVTTPVSGGVVNVGVYARATNGGAGSWAGIFDGDVNINGLAYCTASAWSSDKRFKNNIQEIDNVVAKISKIKGYTYLYKTEEFKNRNFPKTSQIGFLAQELKEIFPQLVYEDREGYFSVNYIGMIPVLLEAIKEQQKQFDEQNAMVKTQQQQIDELKTMVQSLANNSASTRSNNSLAINLSDKNSIVLNQNVPNPFAESTVISYNIPTDFGKAQIIFTTNDGKVIKAIDITLKGEGRLNVFANDLTSGMYSYALVVDGKTIDSKKMIKE